jgi:hypothetical protein
MRLTHRRRVGAIGAALWLSVGAGVGGALGAAALCVICVGDGLGGCTGGIGALTCVVGSTFPLSIEPRGTIF